MYYWLVSWPQQRAKAIKSRGGWRPPGDAAKGWTGKRVQEQKWVLKQKRAGAKRARAKKEGIANVKTQTDAKLATWQLRPRQPTLGCQWQLVTRICQCWVNESRVSSVSSASELAFDKRKFNLVTRRCKVWLGFWVGSVGGFSWIRWCSPQEIKNVTIGQTPPLHE